jgi:endonuclease/exonuclease/phosphatase family metal-dependent hydrolase
MRISLSALFLATVAASAVARAEEVRVVAWNAEASLPEKLEKRKADLQALDAELKPDVLVLVEVTGLIEARMFADHLGWPEYHMAVSDFSDAGQGAFEGLEVAVISRTPIAAATEHDTSPDGTHGVFGSFGELPVAEAKLSSEGLTGIGTTGQNDRGTLRVDLASGLTIFPVHLKSNSNNRCSDVSDAIRAVKMIGGDTSTLQEAHDKGFAKATEAHRSNAEQRERVMAAVKLLADAAVAEGRTAIIAGDFNTSFEPGKVGKSLADCTLQDFSCKRAPFPAAACTGGDGFDDTFGILQEALVGTTKWTVLSAGLGRTYDDDDFADLAIDHIAVSAEQTASFLPAAKSSATFGSDHFAVWTVYTRP